MRSGELTAEGITAAYLERIGAIDRTGPQLRSVLELNPDALAVAKSLDAERKAGRVRGPLHGIPIMLKDNIPSGDRMTTTAGSLMMEGQRVAQDATMVRRLREAGAVLLGKTNLSEWANFRSSNSVSGWSSRGGQTRNPYAPDRSPSGSSSGSAVAAAANLCAAAIGTETDGSIVSPSACNNLVGFKPSVGLVSRTGIVPIAHSQDTAGPMARSVRDCALLMDVMFGADARDAATRAQGVPASIDFTAQLGRADLKGVRLGVGRQFLGTNEKVDELIRRAMERLKELGAELVDVEFASHGRFGDSELEVLLYEFKADLNASTPSWRSTAWTPSWRRRHLRPASSTPSPATVDGVAALRSPPWRAILTSPCPPASSPPRGPSSDWPRWACRSSGPPSATRNCWPSATPSSRWRGTA